MYELIMLDKKGELLNEIKGIKNIHTARNFATHALNQIKVVYVQIWFSDRLEGVYVNYLGNKYKLIKTEE